MIRNASVLAMAGVVAVAAGSVVLAVPQAPAAAEAQRAAVAQLAQRLIAKAQVHSEFERTKDDVTDQLLTGVDGVVENTFIRSMSVASMTAALNALLGHRSGSFRGCSVFQSTLPSGRFIVAGIEVARGGGAFSENAVSLRAYRENGDFLVRVANARYSRADEVTEDGYEPLGHLEMRELPARPIGSEAWYLVWIGVPPRSPYTATIALYAFDGQRFRVVWKREDFITPNLPKAVTVSADGSFSIDTMPDRQQTRVVVEKYALTADGPQKIGESEREQR